MCFFFDYQSEILKKTVLVNFYEINYFEVNAGVLENAESYIKFVECWKLADGISRCGQLNFVSDKQVNIFA